MKRKLVKIVSIIVWTVFLVIFMENIVFGVSGSDLVGSFKGEDGVDISSGESLVKDVVGPILSVVRIVAIGVAVIVLTFLGIKYMSAAPSEKANIKNQLITFTVGAAVVIGATSILSLIRDVAEKATI